MATFKFLSESPTEDDNIHQYELEVTADLGDNDVRKYTQTVVFNPDEAQEKAQEYADQMEADLKEAKESGTLDPVESEETPAEDSEEE